jgi:hypothetical protein
MKETSMISVIIPVYNVEDYLRNALESLLNQTFKDFEVILVNDGSTDSSGTICESYACRYKNFHVYHKANGGQSDARNYGLEKASGEFVTFLDSDDYFEPYALEVFIKLQKKYDADIVSTKEKEVKTIEIKDQQVEIPELEDTVLLLDSKEFLEKGFYNDNVTVSNGGKLYKKQVLQVIYPKGKIYEDLYVFAEIALNASKVVHTDIQVYNYLIREGSTVHSVFQKNQYHFFEAIEHNRTVLKSRIPDERKLYQALVAKNVIGSFILSNQAIKTSQEEVRNIQRKIKPYLKDVLLNKKVPIFRKMQCIIFLLSPNLYYVILNKLQCCKEK